VSGQRHCCDPRRIFAGLSVLWYVLLPLCGRRSVLLRVFTVRNVLEVLVRQDCLSQSLLKICVFTH